MAQSVERLSLENWVRSLAISPEARLKLRQKGRQDRKDLVVKGRRIEQSWPLEVKLRDISSSTYRLEETILTWRYIHSGMLMVEALGFIPLVVSKEEDGAGARCQELEMRSCHLPCLVWQLCRGFVI